MDVRRIVTGHSGGKAVVVSDGAPPKTYVSSASPGSASALLWATTSPVTVPHERGEPISGDSTYIPPVGETRLMVISLAPDSAAMSPDFDPMAFGQELMEHMPDLATAFELDSPGMHTTDTVDYSIVLEGEVWLEVDDGEQVRVKQGDVVVQNGTRHAWRNKTDKPARLAVVMAGAQRNG